MEEITPKIRVQDIDHSGIVAGIIHQMGLVELLDQEMGTHCQLSILLEWRPISRKINQARILPLSLSKMDLACFISSLL